MVEDDKHRIDEILFEKWGYRSFRPLQREIILSVLSGKPTLALLPTGGGKSICFQVPGLYLDGLTLVISPLIALMRDQVDQLNRRGIKAVALTSGMGKREIDIALDNCAYGGIRFLYVSPERLESELFIARLDKLNIRLLAIDEAHCISQWGYDFRPSYLKISEFRKLLPLETYSIALTASATTEVVRDIQEKLGMENTAVFRKSFARDNLSYSVFKLENKLPKVLQILQGVPGSSIVYVRSRKRTREVAEWLKGQKIGAEYYHAGLSSNERMLRQERWLQNKSRVMVATNAFGMGIDKPDVRTVIHLDLPDSIEAYYQEAGRAGRDEKKAYAILLFHEQDKKELIDWISRSFVEFTLVKRVYQALANQYKLAIGSGENQSFDFDYGMFIETFNLPGFETYHALKVLAEQGLIQLDDAFYQYSKGMFTVGQAELYTFQVAHAKFEPIIKVLLRMYGGEMVGQYVDLSETEIGKLLRLSKSEVVNQLKSLVQYELMDYIPTSLLPKITFLQARLEIERVRIDQQFLKWKKERAEEKVNKMEEYITLSHVCRTQIIQAYFNEITEKRCGICDVCISKNKASQILNSSSLYESLRVEGDTLYNLAAIFKTTESDILFYVRQLVEEGKVVVDSAKIFKT